MEEKSRPVSIFMPERLIVQARVEAAKLNMSRSAFVVKAVQRAIRESQQSAGQQQSSGGGEQN